MRQREKICCDPVLFSFRKKEAQHSSRLGKLNKTEKKTKKTCSTIQRQHIRTRRSSCTLLFVRIASAMARAPSSPMLLPPCEIMRMRGGDGGNKTKQKKKLKKRAAQFSNNTYAQGPAPAHCCLCASRLQWPARRRRQCYCRPVK